MAKKILIIDDDADLSMLICDMYEDYGYETAHVINADDAYAWMEKNTCDLILLDINLPETTGFEVCREIRRVSAVPIIFASARTSEDDKITGLDMGGDDYLSKPYSLRELLSRTNSLLRRAYGGQEHTQELAVSDDPANQIVIYSGERRVTRNGAPVSLALKEYDLLLYMARHRGQALPKERLIQEVWGAFSAVETSTLTVHIRWLREKLEICPSKPSLIQTVWGIGYMLQ